MLKMNYPTYVGKIYYSICDIGASGQLPGKKKKRLIPYILHQNKLLIKISIYKIIIFPQVKYGEIFIFWGWRKLFYE